MPLPKDLRSMSAKKRRPILANRYQIEKKLGSGNFGTASLVVDLKSKDAKEEKKVMKEIHVGDLQPDETVDAMHEANLLRHLDHPGIVKFHDSFIENENFCIVTEYCEGGDLDEKISQYNKQGKKLPEPLVIEWLIQLLLAVQYMHSRRVLHRDLKTRNIFLRKNMIKIGDLGISRILMGTSDMASTFTGTPYYMSPEVLKHEGYNSKSDVWSIGCILYEMVALKHAFEGQSLMGVMYKIVESNLPEWPKGYSEDLEDVFHFIMNKDPSKRPSASEVLKHRFVVKHMEKMKNTLVTKHRNRLSDETQIENEANKIAMVLREKSHMEDFIKPKEEDQRMKYMSPRQRMILRKKQKADEEAQRLAVAARVQLDKNREKFEANKETMNAYKKQAAPWAKQEAKKQKKPQADFDLGGRPLTAPMPAFKFDDEDDDDDDDDVEFGHAPVQFSRSMKADDRPITPMKDRMVYSLTASSLDFKDGIPDEPGLAETYYSQFMDEFEGEKPEIKNQGRGRESLGSESGSESDSDYEGTLLNTVKHAPGEHDEVGDLITCMQNALDKSDTIKSQTLTDNTVQDAFGPTVKEIKIKNLRAECEKKLGKGEFQRAYEYLKEARFGEGVSANTDETIMMKELRKIVKNPNDCFLVDQLLFLEEQSKLL